MHRVSNLTERGHTATDRQAFARLHNRMSELTGSDAARLWRAVWEAFPLACGYVMVKNHVQMRGAGWNHIWMLVDALDDAADQIALSPNELFGDGQRTIEGHSAEQSLRILTEAGNALRLLAHGRPTMRNKKPGRIMGLCSVCWRWGIQCRTREYYCELHKPARDNQDYKDARSLMQWKDGEGGSVFFRRYRVLREHRRIGLSMDDPVFHALYDVARGASNLGEVTPHLLDFSNNWSTTPHVASFLDERDADRGMTSSILCALDPLCESQRKIHAQIHQITLIDQRLLASMLLFAEAWLSTAARRVANWGGKRKRNSQAKARAKLREGNPRNQE